MGDDETSKIHKAHHPTVDLSSALSEILRGQRKLAEQVAEINLRLERGTGTLDSVKEIHEQQQLQRDSLVELRTQMRGFIWFAATSCACAVTGIATGLFAIFSKGHP